ncbi:hypothetical protein GCM10022406_41810 [Hymenobacter algoricola]|uniref:Sensor histidine kinase n=2 Tax=Hymenobacter algoricola TaxID=486267 RepID=A0ABP7NXJ1_9BACT
MFFVFATISGLTKLREWVARLDQATLRSVVQYYTENIKLGGSHMLLKSMIKNWEENKVLTTVCGKPVSIVAFRNVNNRFRLITGAAFVSNFSFIDEAKLAESLNQKGIVSLGGVSINNNDLAQNICIQIKGHKEMYMFYIELSKPVNLENTFDAYAVSAMQKSLIYAVKILDIEGQLMHDRNQLIRKLKDKLDFTEKTINVVHFINNRLSPLTNYFEMMELYKYEKKKEDSQSYLPDLKKIINKEASRAKDNLRQINERARSLLYKSVESRNDLTIESIKYKNILRTVRDIWGEHNLQSDKFKIEWQEDLLDSSINIDIDDFWLVVEEIITNMSKHGKGNFFATTGIDSRPFLVFANQIATNSHISQNKKIKGIIDQFNNDEVNEIMKKNSNGLYMIKTYLNKVNINSKIVTKDNFFYFIITFPTIL